MVGEFDGDTRLVVALVSARGSISDVVCCAPCVYDGDGVGDCRGGIGSTVLERRDDIGRGGGKV